MLRFHLMTDTSAYILDTGSNLHESVRGLSSTLAKITNQIK